MMFQRRGWDCHTYALLLHIDNVTLMHASMHEERLDLVAIQYPSVYILSQDLR